MAKATISTPKQARIGTRQRYEPKSKSRSGTSVFARAAQGTPTRSIANPQTTKAVAVRARILKPADSGLAGRSGAKHAFADRAGLASGTTMGTTHRGVSSLWKSGLDFESTRPYPGSPLVENVDVEDEGEDHYEDFRRDDVLREDSDVEWEDERTLIDGLMGFDDECVYSLFSALSYHLGSGIRMAKRIHSIPHFPTSDLFKTRQNARKFLQNLFEVRIHSAQQYTAYLFTRLRG